MADIDEDDEFGSDDIFDELPSNTLLQLEQQASQFAQPVHRRPTYHGDIRQAENQSAWQAQHQESIQSDVTVQALHQDSTYDYDDEEVIDLDQDPYAIQSRYDEGRTLADRIHREAHTSSTNNHVHAPRVSQQPQGKNLSFAELQARIIQLENDRSNLQKQVDEARSTAQSRAGEAAILRQKAEKAAKDHEQKVASIRQLHAEEYAKQKAELDRVKSDREKLTTNNRFLEHDLALETGKNRQSQRVQKPTIAERSKSGQGFSPATTPKKSKVLSYRDGFDDSDLVMLSPSKPRDRSKPSTPKAGAKRKRTGIDVQSPIIPPQLPLSEPRRPTIPPHTQNDGKVAAELLQKLAKEQNKLRFLQKLLQHQVNEDPQENIFEALTRFAFPSTPERKLSQMLFERLSMQALVGAQGVDISFADTICEGLSAIWAQSLAEAYYSPVPCIISSIQRIFELERFSFTRKHLSRVVALATGTSDLVAIPLARASLNKNQSPRPNASRATYSKSGPVTASEHNEANGEDKHKEDAARRCINVVACLELLRTLAEAASPSKDAITEFWQQIKFDFVLVVLMKVQPIEQIGIMLDVLRTSTLQSTFGTISDGERERQDRREIDTLDRLTVLLGEKFDPSREDATATAVFMMREKVVTVLLALVNKDHGALLLATHRHAIGRLFKFLHLSITSLYLHTHPSDHDILIRSINSAVTILYLLCSSTGAAQTKVNVDIRQKLSVIPGGMHVHLLALTRLAFAERIWFERGIEESSMERAHEMLDEWLSPEEGEGLMMMFGSEGSGDGMETQ